MQWAALLYKAKKDRKITEKAFDAYKALRSKPVEQLKAATERWNLSRREFRGLVTPGLDYPAADFNEYKETMNVTAKQLLQMGWREGQILRGKDAKVLVNEEEFLSIGGTRKEFAELKAANCEHVE